MKYKHQIKKDYKRRKQFEKREWIGLQLKSIVCNNILPFNIRMKAMKLLDKETKDSRITRIRNRCIITGRGRGVIPKYRLSRIEFKRQAEFGLLPGIRRASW